MEAKAKYSGKRTKTMRLVSKTDVGRSYEKMLLDKCGIRYRGSANGEADHDVVNALALDLRNRQRFSQGDPGFLPNCAACVYDILSSAATRGILGDAPKNYDADRYRKRAEGIRSGKVPLPNVPFVPAQYRGKLGLSPY